MIKPCVLISIFIVDLIRISNQEIYTSSIKICKLFQLELKELQLYDQKLFHQHYGENFSNWIGRIKQEIPTDLINKQLILEEDCFDENSDISRFIANPINILMLFKRFLFLWPKIQIFSKYPQYDLIKQFIDEYGFGDEDLIGAYQAIYRLQDFYQLEPKDIKIGIFSESLKHISEQWSTVPKFLSARDMLEIGVIAYKASDYTSTISWLKIALEDINSKHDILDDNSTIRLLDYLSWSEYLTGDFDAAFEHCHQILKIDPFTDTWADNLRHFKDGIPKEKSSEEEEIESITKSLNDEEFLKKLQKKYSNYSLDLRGTYEDAITAKYFCHTGRLFKTEKDESLKPMCYVKKGTNKFGKFITVNVEKILDDPGIFIFRSMASEQDILHFKNLAFDDLQTATVYNPENGEQEPAKYRITQRCNVPMK
ncbi:Prolyl 4-hydroxylase subunit alpha-1 [Thelohanellus kitauei]|uniref:Prolyl 4-hydroxylase subunit alpha-1 n=1 Tax=Thelohanellus kitauei TaxID=669202 RepID=A0A0C2MNI6_THEKT|nr:Prolyl 4-hydroxylase subunit alpha-1 [Thelohanellus kitauei]